MKHAVVFTLVVCLAFAALSWAEDENDYRYKPSATVTAAEAFGSSVVPATKPTAKPTTTAKSTTTTTAKPTTTTAKPTTTTAKPTTTTTAKPTTAKPTTTTTAKPTTTTAKPTTAKPTTTTAKPTTAKPTTTTPRPTTPTPPKPTPPTILTTGKYNVTTTNKVICLVAQMALQIRLVTPKANGSFIVQPNMTTAEGGCQDNRANLTLIFKEGSINFMFNKSADNTVYVDAVSFNLSYPLAKGLFAGQTLYTANNKSMHFFAAKLGNSYSCKKESLFMGNGLYLDVDQDRMQAFNLPKNSEFGTAESCAADRPDYRVAIGVGVTLLVLIIIVVVAYLLGRRKRANGYQSL